MPETLEKRLDEIEKSVAALIFTVEEQSRGWLAVHSPSGTRSTENRT
jgi:hypothetical protein